MRNNQPVTQVEHHLEPGKPIVSKTDLQGKILYANESFVKISGFTREELIGADHNIVRHPDMPAQAFADLWRTVKAGQPWRGLVKNRTKSGDFYWVEAFVTPVTEQGRTVGFMSVRTVPSRADVSAAEALYARVRAGSDKLPQTPLPGSGMSRQLWLVSSLAAAGLAVTAGFLGGIAGITLGACSAAVVLGMTGLMRARVLSPLEQLVANIRRLDEGRLAERITAPAATGHDLHPAFVQLEALRIHQRAMFADVLLSADEVETRTGLLESSVSALLKVSSDQSARVAQVASAMEEMSASMSDIAASTSAGLDAAHRTESLAEASKAVMAASVQSSERIAGVVEGSRNEIGRVNESVSRITEVTRIIREIADQTNLLALNAAIEAARAGQQGRGFAVVADEVRKLSERTAQSTEHIGAAVGEIVQQAHTAVDSMQSASTDVGGAAESMRESSRGLDDICNASHDAVRTANEITAMLQQQSAASQDVARAMEHLSGQIDATGANVEQISGATGDLRATVKEMRLLVRHMESALR
jgi:aerotaxis receptor